MNFVWLMVEDGYEETVEMCYAFDIRGCLGERKLFRCTAAGESGVIATDKTHNIDAIMAKIKSAIFNERCYVRISLDEYELSK